MPSNNILDAELRRETYRARFGTAVDIDTIRPTLQTLSRVLVRIMSDYDLNNPTQSELARLYVDIRKEFRGVWGGMWEDITNQLIELSVIESEQVLQVYEDFVPEVLVPPAPAKIESQAARQLITLESNVAVTGTWAQMIARNTDTATKQIVGTIQAGINLGLTRQEIVQQLRGTRNKRTGLYTGGVLNNTTRAQADALVRTGVSHYSNVARDQFAAANQDVLESRILFATLDNRTTTICMKRHLNEYPIGEKYPRLPFHWNERSQYIFKTPGFDPLNTTRPAVGGRKGEKAREEFEKKQARTDRKVTIKGRKNDDVFEVEQISAKKTADAWLRTQPRWFVESTLGKEKARIFLDGGLHIDRFTDMIGRKLTLSELKATSAGERAYRRANNG